MIYLDHQATAPLLPAAADAMAPWLLPEGSANPHSAHRAGRAAAAAVEAARAQLLAALGAGAGEGRLALTGGATEALNWALKGSWDRRPANRTRIVTAPTEHAAVLDSLHHLARRGAELVMLPVDPLGRVDVAAAAEVIEDSTAIVALMHVNNEIGTVGPVDAIGHLARAAGAVMVCDAVQGFTKLPIPLAACDLVAMSAHKVGGPKGIGALWMRAGIEPEPLLHGGGQEAGLRSGTVSPALAAGFGAAARFSADHAAATRAHLAALHDHARPAFGAEWILNGPPAGADRWPGNLNLRLPGLDAAALVSGLRDLAFSVGSACASGSGRPSHVLRAIGLSDAEARASIRLGFGPGTTVDEVDSAVSRIRDAARAQGLAA
ncbi:cysteine desulfurase [Sphingomonas jejuensis]|uniref:Cysteine desulfurase n=1 Tax=Sphingomonas jejuensis TaxID=904715 RepID=A0ABX0XLI7_9SPHN|nr:aminotransferase class V-fold PLP-dependent enzyme [Sphingomonas jejuensis]NJC33631.1 cysteine desulfurase [Sphingomonas jejuensis]